MKSQLICVSDLMPSRSPAVMASSSRTRFGVRVSSIRCPCASRVAAYLALNLRYRSSCTRITPAAAIRPFSAAKAAWILASTAASMLASSGTFCALASAARRSASTFRTSPRSLVQHAATARSYCTPLATMSLALALNSSKEIWLSPSVPCRFMIVSIRCENP